MLVVVRDLQTAYDKAVKEKKETFFFHGLEILTTYAKYYLEYLKSR